VVDLVPNARYGIISVGSNDPAIHEARDILRSAGIETSYLRLRALPINEDVHNFIRDHERLFVVENNRDGQLNLILLSEEPCCGEKLTSIARCNGLPLSAEWIADAIKKQI
jgi:2-oxoglutarate ferredoxin oxidoreductase subunit alpha